MVDSISTRDNDVLDASCSGEHLDCRYIFGSNQWDDSSQQICPDKEVFSSSLQNNFYV